MFKIVGFTWQHRAWLAGLAIALAGGIAGLYRASSLDEGCIKHAKKQFNEARRMPGRLLT